METTHIFFLVRERERSKQSEASILTEMMLLLQTRMLLGRGRVEMGQSGAKVKRCCGSCKCGTRAEVRTEFTLRRPLSAARLGRHGGVGSCKRQKTLEMPWADESAEMREETLWAQKDERDRDVPQRPRVKKTEEGMWPAERSWRISTKRKVFFQLDKVLRENVYVSE